LGGVADHVAGALLAFGASKHLFGLGLTYYDIAGVLAYRLASTHYGPCWLPIYADYPAAFFGDFLQQVT
jgi:hypothetical protein